MNSGAQSRGEPYDDSGDKDGATVNATIKEG
jgi:hypothetical protein